MKQMFDLTGKTALVTGATQGIGFAIAKCLSERGAKVFVNGVSSEEKCIAACEKIKKFADDSMGKGVMKAPFITVNSWNEWTETSYLQPDDLYGYGYLEAIKSVFGE